MKYRPALQQYYRHVDGGLYFVTGISKSTVDLSEHVSYVHVYPFDMDLWHRPIDEWTTERFTLIDHVEAGTMLKSDRDLMRATISENKARRRASEGRT